MTVTEIMHTLASAPLGPRKAKTKANQTKGRFMCAQRVHETNSTQVWEGAAPKGKKKRSASIDIAPRDFKHRKVDTDDFEGKENGAPPCMAKSE